MDQKGEGGEREEGRAFGMRTGMLLTAEKGQEA